MKCFLYICLLFLAAACSRRARSDQAAVTPQPAAEMRDFSREGFRKGTVRDLTGQLDGCTFIIELEDTAAKKIEPMNLADSLKADGLPVWVKYVANNRVMSICMAGEIVTITAIERR